ncbi:MAG TPA: prephenate dehydrogenase/arogenate dehydrogenase family protein, partial [Pirellulales bacterium]|nr:prephenate dehydrogenase/arogenate dehydrogenase family protein [Pirellulales bacterium]
SSVVAKTYESKTMKHWDTVAVVGVGLIGGSIGLGLRRRGLAREVVGVGRRQESLQTAVQLGAVDHTTLDLADAAAEADLIIVCTPVGRIAADVRAAAAVSQRQPLITDVGSTKAQIVAELERGLPGGARFVGSHPLAGGEKNGPAAADGDLFVDRTVVVTPTALTRPGDAADLEQLWIGLGARVVRMSPDDHDRALAATSHLPHLVAAALAAATSIDDLPLTASGWADSTRIAAGDPELWSQIFLSNRANVLAALDRYRETLDDFQQALGDGSEPQLIRLLSEAKCRRDARNERP